MRSLLFSIVFASIPVIAAAEPAETRCYEGTQNLTLGGSSKAYGLVLSRKLDPATSELREEIWSAKDPGKSKTMTAKIDAAAGTFTFDENGIGAHGTGTLTGKPWHWTAQTTVLKKGDIEATTTSTRDGDNVKFQATVLNHGKPIIAMSGTATAFDCAKLADHVAALAKTK